MDNSVPRVQLKRVNPFMGLMIDATTWGDSHDYHRQSGQAHALVMHGWGIVTGLEVDAADPADRSVWIRPGVAVDPEGKLIIVAQPFRYQITTQEPGLIYLVLMFREIPTDPALSIEDGSERPSRLLEAYAIYERDRLPDQPHVELARIQQSAGKKPLKDAADQTTPKVDEIDNRYREQAAIRPGPRTTIGVWKPAEAPAALTNLLAGPTRLLSALTSGVDWRLRRRDQPEGPETPIGCDLLLMPATGGIAFNDAEKNQLSTFLAGGGVMLVEACASAGSADAQKAMATVAQAVGRKPQPVKRDHPLLTSRHIFAAAPPGAASGQLVEADGLILSTADYMCAWTGGTVEKALDRADIRTAVEFAENLLAYALLREGNAKRAQRNRGGGK
ncbi:MAG: DUF4159 domain-containing protein [Chloroflexota bacterium]|nr:DUF4159 domain-containing protein [Chloroflexota bacterium]